MTPSIAIANGKTLLFAWQTCSRFRQQRVSPHLTKVTIPKFTSEKLAVLSGLS